MIRKKKIKKTVEFDPEDYQWIKRMAKDKGLTIWGAFKIIIDSYREQQ